MEMYSILKPDFIHADERGELSQLVHEGYTQVNVLETKKGVIRGGHYHKNSTEAFYVIVGSVQVSLLDMETNAHEDKLFTKGDFFMVFPNVVHSMLFNEDTILVAMYDNGIEKEDGTKDIHPFEI